MGKTSWEVKQRYNNKNYSNVTAMLPKELVAEFKALCKEKGVSQSSVVKAAVEAFIEENKKA